MFVRVGSNMEKSDNNIRHAIVVGGGLVGSLCACFMAKRGYKVDVYEYREDIRTVKIPQGRSINLAFSNRGRKAIRHIGLEEIVLGKSIPMKGRLIHKVSGETKSILYDARTNQCIHSVGRNFLNETLLSELELHPNVRVHFKHKLVSARLEEGTITMLDLITKESFQATANIIIGADGAFSTLRRIFQQQAHLFDYTQKYIEHGYIELSVPRERSNRMIPNHLHIWPRGEFMMIALPNYDLSWTVTLFMPFSRFHSLTDAEIVLRFFEDTFPDAIPVIGRTELIESFCSARPSSLISVKCGPYHSHGKFLLLGDAAHAMVPFYGQGMNAGFEDCTLLNQLLDEYNDNIGVAIEQFTWRRKVDAHAICDLALYNYVEMRDLVTKPTYVLRKILDDYLYNAFPEMWVPLYNSVTFTTTMGYSDCIRNREWQDQVLRLALWFLPMLLIALAYVAYYFL